MILTATGDTRALAAIKNRTPPMARHPAHAILGPMKTVLVVYHSMTGGTRQMVDALTAGMALEQAIVVNLRHAATAAPGDVIEAAGYVFATPENLAAISGVMKDFFDRCYYPALEKINGRPYATLICAGSDGSNAARQIVRIATGWRLRQVAEPLIVCTHAQTPEAILAPKLISARDLDRCRELGTQVAAGIALGIY